MIHAYYSTHSSEFQEKLLFFLKDSSSFADIFAAFRTVIPFSESRYDSISSFESQDHFAGIFRTAQNTLSSFHFRNREYRMNVVDELSG